MTPSELIDAAKLYGWRITERGDYQHITSPNGRIRLKEDRVEQVQRNGAVLCISALDGMRVLYPDRPESPDRDAIYKARKLKGLTRVQCASMVGVKPKTWGRWEFGDFKMSPEKWLAFQEATAPMLNVLPKPPKKTKKSKPNNPRKTKAMPKKKARKLSRAGLYNLLKKHDLIV